MYNYSIYTSERLIMLKFTGDTVGEFYVPDTKVWFTYAETQDPWAVKMKLKHEIHMSDGSVRFADVLKTVVHVCVDESSVGSLVMESWKISKHNKHVKG